MSKTGRIRPTLKVGDVCRASKKMPTYWPGLKDATFIVLKVASIYPANDGRCRIDCFISGSKTTKVLLRKWLWYTGYNVNDKPNIKLDQAVKKFGEEWNKITKNLLPKCTCMEQGLIRDISDPCVCGAMEAEKKLKYG